MSLTIDQSKADQLVKQLQGYQAQGINLDDALQDLIASPAMELNAVGAANATKQSVTAGTRFAITPDIMGFAVKVLNDKITPLKMAILAKALYGNPSAVVLAVLGAFPAIKADEMGKLLIDPQVYPGITYADMKDALNAGAYSPADIDAVLISIFGPPALPIEVNFINPQITCTNASVQTGPGSMFNKAYGGSWIMHFPGASFINVSYNHTKNGFSKVNLVMLELASMLSGHAGYAPIDIYVNNQLVLGNYNGAGGYQWDTFDITRFAVEGNNTISIKFCRGASSNYWLRILRVEHKK